MRWMGKREWKDDRKVWTNIGCEDVMNDNRISIEWRMQ